MAEIKTKELKRTKKFVPYKINTIRSKSLSKLKTSFKLSEERVVVKVPSKDFEARMIFERIDQEILTYNDNLIEKIQLEGFFDNESEFFDISKPVKTQPNIKKTSKKNTFKKDVINTSLDNISSASRTFRKNSSDEKIINATKKNNSKKLYQYINKPAHIVKNNNIVKNLSRSTDKKHTITKIINKSKNNNKLSCKYIVENTSKLKPNLKIFKNNKIHNIHNRAKSLDEAIPSKNINEKHNKKCNFQFIIGKGTKSIDKRLADLETMFGKSFSNVNVPVSTLNSEENIILIKNLLILINDLKKDNFDYKLKTEKELQSVINNFKLLENEFNKYKKDSSKRDTNNTSHNISSNRKRASSMEYSKKNVNNKSKYSNINPLKRKLK